MDSPSPVPPWREAVSAAACSKALKILLMAAGSMPIPVSVTEKRISALGSSSSTLTRTATLPSSVNFMAFPIILTRIWLSRRLSARSSRFFL